MSLPSTLFGHATRIPRRLRDRLRRNLFDLKVGQTAQRDMLLFQDASKLLAYQYQSGVFNRLDLIVRHMAIGSMLGKNDYGMSLYRKMQRERGAALSSEEAFRNLVESITEIGYKPESKIVLGSDQRLLTGAHRLSAALYFDISSVPVEITSNRKKVSYGHTWFESHGFSRDEMDLIDAHRHRLMLKHGIYFQVIIWPPCMDYSREIESYFTDRYNVVTSEIYDLGQDFPDFVRQIYRIDDIQDWKIDKKIQGMAHLPPKINQIKLELIDPRFRKKDINGADISTVAEKIKRDIRKKYAPLIENYFYDITLHIGDNYVHNQHIEKVFKHYSHTLETEHETSDVRQPVSL